MRAPDPDHHLLPSGERQERELAYIVEIFDKDPGRILVYLLAELEQNRRIIHSLSKWCIEHGHLQGSGQAVRPLDNGYFDYDPAKAAEMPSALAKGRGLATLFATLELEEREKVEAEKKEAKAEEVKKEVKKEVKE